MGIFRRAKGSDPNISVGNGSYTRASQIVYIDHQGHDLQLVMGDFILSILPDEVNSCWHRPDELSFLLRQVLNFGLIDESLELSNRLMAIDRYAQRAACLRAEALSLANRNGDAIDLCNRFVETHDQAGQVLFQLAKLYDRTGETQLLDSILDQAVQDEPNDYEILDWWATRKGGQKGSHDYLRVIRGLSETDKAWLPLLIIARSENTAVGPKCREVYSEILNRGGHDSFVLSQVIADLGISKRYDEIVELVGPWYNPTRHTPDVGLAILQACVDAGRVREAEQTLVKLSVVSDHNVREETQKLVAKLDSLKHVKNAVELGRMVEGGVTEAKVAPTPSDVILPSNILNPDRAKPSIGSKFAKKPEDAAFEQWGNPIAAPKPALTSTETQPEEITQPNETSHSDNEQFVVESDSELRTSAEPAVVIAATAHEPATPNRPILANLECVMKEELGWFAEFGFPEFLLPTKHPTDPSTDSLFVLPFFCERPEDAQHQAIALGTSKLIAETLAIRTSARINYVMPRDPNGIGRMLQGSFLTDQLRQTLVGHLPLANAAICGEVSGPTANCKIRLIITDPDTLHPAWSYAVAANESTINRAIDELVMVAEEALEEAGLVRPNTPPGWYSTPPVYLGLAYAEAEAATLKLTGLRTGIFGHAVLDESAQLLNSIRKLVNSHLESALPKLMFIASAIALNKVAPSQNGALKQEVEQMINAEVLMRSPLKPLAPLVRAELGLDGQKLIDRNQLADSDRRFADWADRSGLVERSFG